MKMMRPHAGSFHPREIMTAQPHAAQHIHLEEAEPVFIRNLFKSLRLEDAHVVDEDIDVREPSHRLGNSVGSSKVRGEAYGIGSCADRRRELCQGRVDALLGPTVDDDSASLARQRFGNRVSDASGRTANERELTLQLKIHAAWMLRRMGSDATIEPRFSVMQNLREQPLPECRNRLETLAHSGVSAGSVAATTDDVCGLRLAFAIRAAIIAVFPGDALATGMGAFLLGFHAHPSCTLASELLHGVL